MKSQRTKDPSCVQIICRIRKPLDSELVQKSAKSRKAGANPDFGYSIFTTARESNLVLLSEVPVPGKQINSTFKISSDLTPFVASLDNKPTTYMFDSVAGDYITQESFYNQQIRGIVQGMIKGYSGTILAYGPTG